jgi:hypothetical protein
MRSMMQRSRGLMELAAMPQCKFASMPQCIFASMPHCKFATMPQCKCAEQHTAPLTSTTCCTRSTMQICCTRSTMQIRCYATVHVCRTAHRPSHLYHVLYTLHNANSLLCHSARVQNSTPPLSPLPRAVRAPQCSAQSPQRPL